MQRKQYIYTKNFVSRNRNYRRYTRKRDEEISRPKSDWANQHSSQIYQLYIVEEKSMKEIADVLKTNTQRVFRALKALKIERRNQSEAQKNALKTGRAKHPTAGKELSEENKQHLSESIAKAWANISPEEREKRSKKAKENYDKLSDKKKANLRYAATLGVLNAAKEGSKLERFLVDGLTENGYNVVFHKKGYVLNENLEIDILLPAKKIAIEVDGVFHHKDVFGDLKKVKSKDNEKNGLLLSNGYVVIRLENASKTDSKYYMNKKLEQLLEAVRQVEAKFPPNGERLIQLNELSEFI